MIALIEDCYNSAFIEKKEAEIKKNNETRVLAKHFIFDFKNCTRKELLNDGEFLLEILKKIALVLDLKVIDGKYYNFTPQGTTAFCLLSESHISIHTWPEYDRALIDILSCKDFSEGRYEIAKFFLSKFFSEDFKEEIIER